MYTSVSSFRRAKLPNSNFFEGMDFNKTFKCWQLIKCVLRKHTVQLQSKLKCVKNKNNLRVTLLIYSLFQTNFSHHLLFSFYQYRLFHGSGEQGIACNLVFRSGLILQSEEEAEESRLDADTACLDLAS